MRRPQRVNLNLKGLMAMRAVITDGTVTAAARRLHRTQPVVSRMIAQLEHSVGFALFRREGRRLIATPQGLAFYREAERALSALAEIESAARNIGERRDAPLRILAQSHMAHGLLHIVLGEFCKRHPDFRFAVEIRQREFISHWIANRQFDVGFAPRPVDHPQVETELFVRAPLFVALPAAHPLAHRRQIRPKDLAGEPLVAGRPGSPLRSSLDALFAAIGVAPNIRGETFTAVSACQLAGRGVGVALADPFVPSMFLDDPAVRFRPLAGHSEHDYLVLWPVGQPPSAMARRFIDCARGKAREVIAAVLRLAAPGRRR
jgi:DNA-binding transcriptional LysR family regulator